MADIQIDEIRENAFEVTVREDTGSTVHEVTIPDGYLEELGLGDTDPAAVVEASFRFLLEREPKESILGTFELPVISRYFPEYPDEIPDRIG